MALAAASTSGRGRDALARPAVHTALTCACVLVGTLVLAPSASAASGEGELRPGESLTLDELVAWHRERRIASFKLPERLEVRDEQPRNPVGKVLKRLLRRPDAPTVREVPEGSGAGTPEATG